MTSIVQRFQDAMLTLDPDALADLHAPDAVYEFALPTPGRPERYRGRDEIRSGFRDVWGAAARDLRVREIRGVTVHETTDPEVLVVEHEAVVEVLSSGELLAAPSLVVLRSREGRLVLVRDYSCGGRRRVESRGPDGDDADRISP